MKFLDLNTGYTFDGLWHNWMPWTDWEVHTFKSSDIGYYINSDSTEFLFSYNYDDGDPNSSPTNWVTEFDAAYTKRYAIRTREPQLKGYIFWFPNEQSTNIVYTMPICIVTDNDAPINIKVEENDVFSIIESGEDIVTIDGYTFNTPDYKKEIKTIPQQLTDNKWAHVFNVSCCAHTAGEYICKISINDDTYIRVGADLYGEWEPHSINLANMGVELPDMIQKAIYETNVHEDSKNNIIINRKLKELLSNYWEIVANRGSYKSLVNSLKWFEWGDHLTIKEIWKHDVAGRTIFDDRALMTIFEDGANSAFTNFVKTSYISLYCYLQDELSTYDVEMNPNIEQAVFKWAQEDIRLKMSLLSQYFNIHFMPVHMAVLYAAAENIVFTNTIKSIYAAGIKRHDSFGDFNYVECNIKDGTIFNMTNVSVQATPDTTFANEYSSDQEFMSLGVTTFPSNEYVDETNIQTFAANYYTGPGVIIPVELTIPNQSRTDFVKYTVIDYNNGMLNENNRFYFYDIFETDANNNIKVKFKLVAKFAGNYTVKFIFALASGKTITRRIDFKVEDTDNLNINIYKIQAKDDSKGFTYADFNDGACNKYLTRIQGPDYNLEHKPYMQYLPYMSVNDTNYENYKGIKLTRTIVIDLQNKNGRGKVYTADEIDAIHKSMKDDFLEFVKSDENKNKTYLIYVSKRFNAELPSSIANNNIIRNDLGFYPQFHKLEKLNGHSIDDYTISQYDAICCAAEINDGKTVKDFKYGHILNGTEWEFTNVTTSETIQHPASATQPFIANNTKKLLDKGTYGIKLNYSLTNGYTHTCELKRAFKVK